MSVLSRVFTVRVLTNKFKLILQTPYKFLLSPYKRYVLDWARCVIVIYSSTTTNMLTCPTYNNDTISVAV